MTSPRPIVIAGSNKCGTTSVFRYLSDHPAVCGSAQKETDFFHKAADYDSKETLRNYMKLFPSLSANHDFCVEATPTYLDSGRKIAGRMNQLLDKPYVLLLLRDPTERIVSYYRSKHGLATSQISGLTFNEFVDRAMSIALKRADTLSVNDERIGNQIEKAHYERFLEDYLQTIPASQMRIMFFEDIRDTPRESMQTLCDSIGLNSSFYLDYSFHVENRSRYHRNAGLRTLATKINATAEPVLNRIPFVRRKMRSFYDAVNTIPGKGQSFDAEKLQDLRDHFQPHNDSLRSMLERNFDIDRLPEWLSAK